MRDTVRRLLAVAAVAAAPAAAAAQPQVYCPPGVFAGCLAIEVRDTDTGAVVRLQNLQGSLIGSDDVFRLSVNRIRINLTDPSVWLHSSDFSIGWPYVHENVTFVGRSGAALNGFAAVDLLAPATTDLPVGSALIRGVTDRQLNYYAFAGVLLEGCRNTTNATVGRYPFAAATCPSEGLDGWLEIGLPYGLFDRTTNELLRPISAADITVDWEDTQAWTDERNAVVRGCTTGVNCDVYDYAAVVAVAPEPGTWMMLGTGLLALGGLAARRRSRDA